MRHLLIIACLFITVKISAQEIYEIHLSFTHSLRLTNYNVNIDAERHGNNYTLKVVTKDGQFKTNDENEKMSFITTKDSTFVISAELFQSLVNSVKKISCNDIILNVGTSGEDGNVCAISFGNFGSAITYTIWSPEYATQERRLSNFLEAFKLLLATAGLKPNKIL